jgi:fatty acid desaturase
MHNQKPVSIVGNPADRWATAPLSAAGPPEAAAFGVSGSISDPRSSPTPIYARWGAALLNDSRDVAFVGLMIECAIACSCGVLLWLSHLPMLIVGPVYWAALFGWVFDRFTLMLHCTSHRPLFRRPYRALNYVIPWLLGPFFGQTPNTYFAHHIAMHHREENLAQDLSTTISFRRDRLRDWFHYYSRFMFLGLFDLAAYLRDRRRFKVLKSVLIGEGCYWSAMLLLGILRPAATFVVFFGPLLFIRTLMMIGNWGQHAFVCPEQPDNAYRASIVCVNTRYNRRCFNDGYHILHHLQPRCHWSDHAREFERDLVTYGQNDAIVFDGLDFFQVWLCLMLRRWQILARHFVQLPGAPARSTDEIIVLLRARVARISARSAAREL